MSATSSSQLKGRNSEVVKPARLSGSIPTRQCPDTFIAFASVKKRVPSLNATSFQEKNAFNTCRLLLVIVKLKIRPDLISAGE